MIGTTDSILLDEFNYSSDKSPWRVVDDVVMGGRSDGAFKITEDETGLYSGEVSLKNNGGFSSVRRSVSNISLEGKTTIKMRIKGDGKQYQFRIKERRYDRHSFIAQFETSGDWEEVSIDLTTMYPAFRGRVLRIPNYEPGDIAEIAILIGNKKEESFQLEIDWIRAD